MGLLIRLRNTESTTKYKTLKFSPNTKPYIVTPIPKDNENGGSKRELDFLLSNNTLIGANITDTDRLLKMFTDFRSSGGSLFTLKQNYLSLSNVNSSVGYATIKSNPFTFSDTSSFGNVSRTRKNIVGRIANTVGRIANTVGNVINKLGDLNPQNQGPYIFTSTLAQTAINGSGIHLTKQGLIPLTSTQTLFPNFLGNTPFGLPTYLNTVKGFSSDQPKTRMQTMFNSQLNSNNPETNTLLTYTGGPDSFGGVGLTNITVAIDPLGIKNSVFDPPISSNGIFSLSLKQIQGYSNESHPQGYGDFTKTLNPNGNSETIPQSLDWGFDTDLRIEQRVNLGNPGEAANRSSYVVGRRGEGKNSPTTAKGNSRYKNALDKLNALPIYQSGVEKDKEILKATNDLVKFRIGVINNNNPSLKTYVHFRALIDSMSDNYSSEWEAQKFMGRGENFYKYSGFDRQISLSWTVAAQSKQELIPMYQKLNYLASVCAPDYSSNGYMRGNLISLTVGGWCHEQVGIMKGINLEVPGESPWEIGIGEGTNQKDSSVKELPMIVKVTGFTFVPIHNFVPKIQRNFYGGNEDPKENKVGFVSKYGDERYIGLKDEEGNNYSRDSDPNYTPQPSNNVQNNEETSTATNNGNTSLAERGFG